MLIQKLAPVYQISARLHSAIGAPSLSYRRAFARSLAGDRGLDMYLHDSRARYFLSLSSSSSKTPLQRSRCNSCPLRTQSSHTRNREHSARVRACASVRLGVCFRVSVYLRLSWCVCAHARARACVCTCACLRVCVGAFGLRPRTSRQTALSFEK